MTFPRSHVWDVARSGSGPGQLGSRICIRNLCPLWPGSSLALGPRVHQVGNPDPELLPRDPLLPPTGHCLQIRESVAVLCTSRTRQPWTPGHSLPFRGLQ